MIKKMSLQEIKEYWTSQAVKFKESPAASWSDQNVIKKEINEIITFLDNGDKVIDIGCANGYSTVQFAYNKHIQIKGIDYIPEMIEQAKKRFSGLQNKLLGSVKFDVGNILNLNEEYESYDKVIVIRVIINLGNYDNQLKGLKECAKILKRGGLLLLSEATMQGWQKLNKFRSEWGLPDIPMPTFNLYIDHEKIEKDISDYFELVKIIDFASTYYVGTRVLKPLLVQALGIDKDVADTNTEWNRWFEKLPTWGDYGTQKLFVFKKI